MIDRQEVNRALAKAIAFKQCGKHAEASAWAVRLVELLDCAGIVSTDALYAASHTAGNREMRS